MFDKVLNTTMSIIAKLTFYILKSDSYLPKKFGIFASFESPLKIMTNAFYFILKAFFVLKIFRFLP